MLSKEEGNTRIHGFKFDYCKEEPFTPQNITDFLYKGELDTRRWSQTLWTPLQEGTFSVNMFKREL